MIDTSAVAPCPDPLLANGARKASPITILVAALGGQGGGVLTEWLVEVATRAGYPAQSTSIPGVAQRTGATTYYIEIYPVPLAALGGRRPLLSLLPVPGCIDLLIASELLEAARIVGSGMVSPLRTLVVTSSARTLTTAEKMPMGDGRVDSTRLADVIAAHSRRMVAFDMDEAAREAGTIVSAVMFGAIAASGALPFGRSEFDRAIRVGGAGAEASLAGFARGWAAVALPAASTSPAASAPSPNGLTAPAVDPRVAAALPPATHDLAGEGYRRLVEYQDAAYADLYLQRLARVRAVEEARDPAHGHRHDLTRESARFLALWMMFEDIVFVADRKCRAGRFARVRSEVAAAPGDVVRIVDYFKPGMAEVAALLPTAIARRLLAWDRARVARGKPPLAFALTVRTDGIAGFLTLRLLASLRGLRRRGARFAEEQAMIERWLSVIEGATTESWALGFEIALCGRLIKGYGATSERGKRNLLHILDHLAIGAPGSTAAERATAIKAAREAGLADEDGKAFDAALVSHGAPARPVVAQPIRWVKRRPAPAAGEAR